MPADHLFKSIDPKRSVENHIQESADLLDTLHPGRDRFDCRLDEVELLYRHAPVGLGVLDKDLRYRRINERLAEMNGISVEDHIGRTMREVIPDFADQVEQKMRKVLESGEPLLEVEISGVTAARPEVGCTWRVTLMPLKDGGGDPIGISLVVQENTARKQAEEALHRIEQHLSNELSAARLLQEVSTQLIRVDDAQALYEKILDTAVAVMHADFASIQMYHPERGTEGKLLLIGHRGFSEQTARFWKWVRPDSESACGVALRTRERVVVPNVRECRFMAGSADLEIFLQNSIHAVQTTPLLSRSGTLIGMLSTQWRQPHTPTESQLRSLDVLARQAADLIDRKVSEEALRRSESRLASALRIAQLGIWDFNPVSRVVRFDQRCREIFGISEDRPIPEAEIWQMVHPDDRRQVEGQVLAALDSRGNGSCEFVYRIVRSDGETAWVAVRGSAIHSGQDADSGSVRFIGTAMDITERRRAEETLRESKARLSAILNELPIGVGVFDNEGRAMLLNDLMRKFTPDTLPSREPERQLRWQAVDSAGNPTPPENWPGARALRGESVIPGVEFAHTDEDGREQWVMISAVPFSDLKSGGIGAIAVAQDITELKQAERTLRETNQELNEYTYAVVHNVKAPFRAVQNYANFLLEDLADTLGGEPKQFLAGIKKAVHQASQQFSDLDALYLIKNHTVYFEPVDIQTILGEIVSMYSNASDRQMIISEQWPVLRTDRFLLRQILLALIDNGIKYNLSAVKRVGIDWHKTTDGVEISVRDNGIGIDPQYHEHVFQIFKRLHTDEEYEGTGIGLSLVKKALQIIGGSLRLESAAGEGSTFIVSLPAAMIENGQA